MSFLSQFIKGVRSFQSYSSQKEAFYVEDDNEEVPSRELY